MPRLQRQKSLGRSKQDYATPLVLLHAVQRRPGIGVFALRPRRHGREHRRRQLLRLGRQRPRTVVGVRRMGLAQSPLRETGAVGATRGRAVAARAHTWPCWCRRVWAPTAGARSLLRVVPERTITFVGETTPYPRDCALLLYGPDIAPGYDIRRWTNDSTRRFITGRTYCGMTTPACGGVVSPLSTRCIETTKKERAKSRSASPTPKTGSVTIWPGPNVGTGSERCRDTGPGRSSLPPRSQPEPGIAESATVRLPA